MEPVPRDGETLGEVMLRGNVVMKGYLKNKTSTDEAFAGGWFHSGDLGVMHPDGYIQLKDRSKDIIISGGENISSIEVEDALYKHPAVQAAAVVAKPDDKWGETPCAFVELKPGAKRHRRRAHRVVPAESRRLQGAAPHRVRRDAEDLHGQDPEIQAARDGEERVMQSNENRQVRLKSRPTGIPQAEHFEVATAPVPELAEGQILVRNQFLSVEPAMRGWVNAAANYSQPVGIGEVMRSFAAGTVIASKNPQFAEGDRVMGMFGWQDFAIVGAAAVTRKVKETDLPLSLSLGVLGLNGVTAYSRCSMSAGHDPATPWWFRPRRGRSAPRSGRSRTLQAAAPSASRAGR